MSVVVFKFLLLTRGETLKPFIYDRPLGKSFFLTNWTPSSVWGQCIAGFPQPYKYCLTQNNIINKGKRVISFQLCSQIITSLRNRGKEVRKWFHHKRSDQLTLRCSWIIQPIKRHKAASSRSSVTGQREYLVSGMLHMFRSPPLYRKPRCLWKTL